MRSYSWKGGISWRIKSITVILELYAKQTGRKLAHFCRLGYLLYTFFPSDIIPTLVMLPHF